MMRENMPFLPPTLERENHYVAVVLGLYMDEYESLARRFEAEGLWTTHDVNRELDMLSSMAELFDKCSIPTPLRDDVELALWKWGAAKDREVRGAPQM